MRKEPNEHFLMCHNFSDDGVYFTSSLHQANVAEWLDVFRQFGRPDIILNSSQDENTCKIRFIINGEQFSFEIKDLESIHRHQWLTFYVEEKDVGAANLLRQLIEILSSTLNEPEKEKLANQFKKRNAAVYELFTNFLVTTIVRKLAATYDYFLKINQIKVIRTKKSSAMFECSCVFLEKEEKLFFGVSLNGLCFFKKYQGNELIPYPDFYQAFYKPLEKVLKKQRMEWTQELGEEMVIEALRQLFLKSIRKDKGVILLQKFQDNTVLKKI